MSTTIEFARAAAISGTVASLVTTALLAALSVSEDKAALRATNATSHWLHGDRAGHIDEIDAGHTGLGYVTHHASAVFWAALFEMIRPSPQTDIAGTARAAALTAAIAGLVDYGLVPRRVTPGWELVMPARKVAMAFVALAAGLTVGGLVSARA